ncbi:MAG: LysM peptidoglycan-binding domain-containing protein [Sedimentisphaerales bacterium]|nr:LysM peptidoglycan-binding domain-containing protein [Sedimentisphaerales bacterium]
MPKDLKIGMILGLVLVTAAMFWLFTGPGINLNARALNTQSNPRTTTPGPTEKKNSIKRQTQEQDTDIYVKEESNQLPSNDKQSEESELVNNRQPEKIKSQRFHIIRPGETLSEISRHYYGSATKWQKILDANQHLIQDVSRLKPGTKIIVPE